MEHYYSEEQTTPLNIQEIEIHIKNISIPLYSGSGVFSKKRLDKGTSVLLKYMKINDNSKILDLGCGIGIVGIYVKKMFSNCDVFFSDVNKRAAFLARKNLKLNKIHGKVFQCDGFQKIKDEFDLILLNPPQVAGKNVCFRLIEESFEHITPGGSLQIVARHNKGGKSLSEKMLSVFGNKEELGIKSGYRVYSSQKKH